MTKKRVPDWLNSSLWYSRPPDDDRFLPYASLDDSDDSEPAPEPPVPEPPPVEPPKTDASRGRNDDDNGVPSVEEISRHSQILTELSKKVINMRELRRIASLGIPDGAGIRPVVWKLLLGYLPPDRSLWPSELAKKRSQYKSFKAEILMNPSEITRKLEKSSTGDNDDSKCQSKGVLSRAEIPQGEHPLSLGNSSVWNKFFQDVFTASVNMGLTEQEELLQTLLKIFNESFLSISIRGNTWRCIKTTKVLGKIHEQAIDSKEAETREQIDRDVKRTHPDIPFFSGDTPFAKSTQEALRNILTMFAKLNPGIRYVQGMNEVLAPLFYVFRNDPDVESVAAAEADTFFCFTELLSGFRDNYCQQLDNSVVGIRATITRLSQLLKEHDEELWRHLEVMTKVNPQFYAFRWITLLLTQEFKFADILHIWDTLLSDPEGPEETLLRVCCAMLIIVRRRLLAGDFTSNLKLLQHYPSNTNINHLLFVANQLRTGPSA